MSDVMPGTEEDLNVQEVPDPDSMGAGGPQLEDTVHTPQQPGEEPLVTECAFIMFLTPDGHWAADTNLTRMITSAREASFNDFYHAACTVMKDIEASETAQRVLIGQQNMAQHMAEQMQTRELAKQIGGPIGKGITDLSKLRGR